MEGFHTHHSPSHSCFEWRKGNTPTTTPSSFKLRDGGVSHPPLPLSSWVRDATSTNTECNGEGMGIKMAWVYCTSMYTLIFYLYFSNWVNSEKGDWLPFLVFSLGFNAARRRITPSSVLLPPQTLTRSKCERGGFPAHHNPSHLHFKWRRGDHAHHHPSLAWNVRGGFPAHHNPSYLHFYKRLDFTLCDPLGSHLSHGPDHIRCHLWWALSFSFYFT